MNGKLKFLEAMKSNKCKRCWAICCNRNCFKACGKGSYDAIKHKYMGKQWPKFVEVVEPPLIKWKNLGVGKIKRNGKILLTYILSFFIILLCFMAIVYIISFADEYKAS